MGDFQSNYLHGVRLYRYLAAIVISGQRSSGKLALIRIVRALVIISPPDRSAAPF
jgi:hypothetical protein